ncbi:MAG: pilus assembly protein PilP [Pseudomonadota bacterium]
MNIQRCVAGRGMMPVTNTKRLRLFMLFVLIPGLFGCTGSDHSDLRSYINSVKAKPGGRIKPVPEFKTYEIYEYSALGRRDPFKMFDGEAEAEETSTQNQSSNGIKPPVDRNKEALEQFPLDALTFAGHLEKDGKNWAIIMSPDKLVHKVQVGNYMGMNYGKIDSISETKIVLTEIIEDGMGGWTEREAALSLSE